MPVLQAVTAAGSVATVYAVVEDGPGGRVLDFYSVPSTSMNPTPGTSCQLWNALHLGNRKN